MCGSVTTNRNLLRKYFAQNVSNTIDEKGLLGGELIQVPGTCIERVKLIDPGFSKIKKVMGVLVLKTFSLYILYGGKIIFFVWDNALAKIRKIEKREKV